MDQLLLDSLNQAIESNLQNDQFGVTELAEAAGLSKSQLNHKLQTITTQSASQFIREYRLKKALGLLQNKAATPSEVSYKVGFGSPSYFSTCFKEYYGYSPNEVKYRDNGSIQKKSTIKWNKNIQLLSSAILILSIAFVLYYIFTPDDRIAGKSNSKIKIAVLPFNLNANDSSDQVLARFIAEDISTKLSKISQFNVIESSFIESIEISEIGKNLSADVLLRISFTIIEERFHLRINLSSANDFNTIWSDSFKSPLSDIQEIQSEVVFTIAKELGVNISSNEEKQITKKLSQSNFAYNHYLVGSDFLSRLQTEKNMRLASDQFEKAIALDSGFAQAWIGLYSANSVIYERNYDRSKNQYQKVQDTLKRPNHWILNFCR